jgi:diguanylate cyclase (GGDEF)-like protein
MSVAAGGDLRRALAPHRDRIFHGLAIAGSLTLLPFAINNFVQGRIWLGISNLLVVVGFGVNALAIFRGRPTPLPIVLVLLPGLAALPLAVHSQGVVGALWTYPALVMFHFVLERRQANALNVTLVLAVSAMSVRPLGVGLSVRVFVTLMLTILFSNIFSAIVERLQRQLEEQAIRDPLTGALNRRQLDRCLDDAVERRRRYGNPATLVVVDLDHFKRINDGQGHEVGDRVLQEVVVRLRARLRRLDLLFRSGGEEFVVLLPQTGVDDAVVLAEELRATCAGEPLAGNAVTLSAGVAEATGDDDRESWMRRGDRALYAAKSAGRDRVVRADESVATGVSATAAAPTS